MKQYISFVKKEFLHILRDRRTILILLGMPIVQIVLFGFAISTEVNNIRLGVFDASRDAVTTQISDRVASNSYYEMELYAKNVAQIEEAFKNGKVDVALIFGENFEEQLLATGRARVQILADGSDPTTAQAAVNYTTAILQQYAAEYSREHALGATGVMQVGVDLRLLFNPKMEAAYNFVPGVMGLILMLVCAMMTAVAIVREKERGTMEVLLASPLRPIFIILAKITPYFVLSCLNVVTILLLSYYVLGVPIVGSIFWLAVLCVIYIMTALALGIFISTITHDQVTAMMISGVALMMPTTILSGMIFPVESMPAILQWVSNIIPARWFIMAVRKIMIEGVDVTYIIKEMAVLIGMMAVLTTISLKKFSKRLE